MRTSSAPLWAIVTSATLTYAGAALPTAGIDAPPHLITANDVPKGKPHPDPYLIGAEKINADVKESIVVEDAPSGIKSGVAAGSRVLAVCTSHERAEIEGLGATWIVTDLSKYVPKLQRGAMLTKNRVKTAVKDGKVHLEIDESP